MVELERSKCMVKASCNAKFPSPRFGVRASSFSSNYGFYAEIPDLVAKRRRKTSVFAFRQKVRQGKTLARSFRRQPLLTNNGCKASQLTSADTVAHSVT